MEVHTALDANTLGEATLAAERTYEYHANAHDKVTLAAKVDAHGETAHERLANARGEATLAAKLNARGKAAYERAAITHGEATLERVSL